MNHQTTIHGSSADTMNSPQQPPNLENDLASLLKNLTDLQTDLLDVLNRKRQAMAAGDHQGMSALQQVELELCQRLQQCHDDRTRMLEEAGRQGKSSRSLGELASILEPGRAGGLSKKVKEASGRMGLLQHSCLANWVLAQKALLHVSQMLEIIANGGRLQPTYGNRANHTTHGTLVDQEV